MVIVQDLYTKSVLGVSESTLSVDDTTQWGIVTHLTSGNGHHIAFVKSSVTQDILGNDLKGNVAFLEYLENVIIDRKNNPTEQSYTSSLMARGINKVAQKVGEEAVEVVIEAKDNDKGLFLNETSDLLYHILVLVAAKEYKMDEVIDVLIKRH